MLHRTAKRIGGWPTPILLPAVLAIAWLLPDAGWGQLSDADLAELQSRAVEEGWTFTVGRNPATEVSLDSLCGLVVPDGWWINARFDPCTPTRDLPPTFDWRTLGGCTPVKNQGNCGSCWAFGTVGPLECNIKIKDAVTTDLSEQWLVSCNRDGWSCGGGWWAHDYHQWKTDPCGGTGAVLEADFPYTATNAPCNCPYPHEYLIDSWAYIGNDSSIPPVSAVKQAIMDYGPVSVAVYANSAMQGYTGGVFNGCASGQVNHAVVLVGWDDNQGSGGVWFMRNSWGTGWGENGGYMRIPYNCSSIGYAACYVNYAGTAPRISFAYPDGRPEMALPGGTTFRVNVLPDTGNPVPGTGQLHFQLAGGGWSSVPMQELAPNQYKATLPPAACFSIYDWYVSAEIAEGGTGTDPKDAPVHAYHAIVATGFEVLLDDAFETDQGWTVYAGATLGNWERADPEQVTSGGVITQPGDDHTAAGTLCYVTGPRAGSSAGAYDVDGGPTHLTSPVLNLEGTDAMVSYWRWYHISTVLDDELVVAVSNDNGSTWTTVEVIAARQEWTYVEWRVGQYVTPTAQVRVRFTADDTPNNSLVEALVDDFKVEKLTCVPPNHTGDVNCDGQVDFGDINPFVLALTDPVAYEALYPGCPLENRDINGDGRCNFGDINPFVALLAGR
jgi:hypothetical protein